MLGFRNIGLGYVINVRIYWYELIRVKGLSSLDDIGETNIENFYDKMEYSNFTNMDIEKIKCEPWLIYTEFDLKFLSENLFGTFITSVIAFLIIFIVSAVISIISFKNIVKVK